MSDQEVLLDIKETLGELKGHSKAISNEMIEIRDNLKALSGDFSQHKNESEAFRVRVHNLETTSTSQEEKIEENIGIFATFKEEINKQHNRFYGFAVAIIVVVSLLLEGVGAAVTNFLKLGST